MVGYHQTNQKTDTGKTLTRWPVLVDHNIMTFEETLDELLNRRRALARDMLKASSELTAADFEAVLTRANTN